MFSNRRPISIGLILLLPIGLVSLSTAGPPEIPNLDNNSLPDPVSADWWQTTQQEIGRAEYLVTWQERTHLPDLAAAYHAPNRAQNLRTYFTPQGIRVIPRTGDETTWQWGLALTAYGRTDRMQAAPDPELVSESNRVEYRRGGLVEWYLNDSRGLEQGFTFEKSPGQPTSPLLIELVIIGNLVPVTDPTGSMIHFQSPDGVAILDYGDLKAIDAEGRELPACLATSGSRLTIEVDDTGAVYPVVIDPLATTSAWTAESNASEAAFAYSVATAGDIDGDGFSDVLVGAPNYDGGDYDEGRTYLFLGSSSGLGTTAWFM